MKRNFAWLGALLILLLAQGTTWAQTGKITILKQTKESFHFEYTPEEKIKKMFPEKIMVKADLVEKELVNVDYSYGVVLRKGINGNDEFLAIDFSKTRKSATTNTPVLMNNMASSLYEVIKPDLKQKSLNQYSVKDVALAATGFLAAWPPGVPLMADKEVVRIGKDEITVPRQKLEEMRRVSFDATSKINKKIDKSRKGLFSWISLCDLSNNDKVVACYPKRLIPFEYIEETVVLVNGKCLGRCGGDCDTLCKGKRYTQDCLNHDACVRNYKNIVDPRCDVIFIFCFWDCFFAPNCPNLGGSEKTAASLQ